MTRIFTLTKCNGCGSRVTLTAIIENEKYQCKCTVCEAVIPIYQDCPDCYGQATTVRRSASQYRLWCHDCKSSIPLFYDCFETSQQFLRNM